MTSAEVERRVSKASTQRLRRLVNDLRARFSDVPRAPTPSEFSKVSEHPTLFRENVSRLIKRIQDEDRARLLEPAGPKILRGRAPARRPKTAIISIAAQAALERRLALEESARELSSKQWVTG